MRFGATSENNIWILIRMLCQKKYWQVQLNKYETATNLIQWCQNLTSNCLLISVFLPVFAWCNHNIVLQIKTKQFYDHIMQKLVKTGKYTEINKQSYIKFWLNWIEFGAVSYLLGCTVGQFTFGSVSPIDLTKQTL